MEPIIRDIRMALRGFRRTPTFPVVVSTILGVSIGATVAMFTTLQAILLERLPVAHDDAIVVVAPYRVRGVEISPPATLLPQLRKEITTLSSIAGVGHAGAFPSPYLDGERTLTLNHAEVTANYFEVLGTRAMLGRLLRAEDAADAAAPAMVISYKTWRAQFGGDSAVVGRKLMWPYTRVEYTIVGVAPPGLDYPLASECWTPMSRTDSRQVLLVGRLSNGVSIAAAEQEVFHVSKRLKPEFELTGASAESFRQAVVGNVQPAILAISAAVALLLLIASINVGSLFLARAMSRARELYVRLALGATRNAILRQLVTESALLAIAGGLLGIICSAAFLRILLHFAPAQLPRIETISIDAGVVLLTVAITTLSALVFGLIPSLLATRSSGHALATAGRATTHGKTQMRLRDGLVMTQVAIAVVMLAVAGLVSSSLLRISQVTLGYKAEQLAIATFAWDANKFSSPAQMLQWGQRLEQSLRELPGIEHVSPILIPPFLGESVWHTTITAESAGASGATAGIDVPIEIGGTDYFATMAMPILRGRGFTVADEDTSIRTMVISETVARRLWADSVNPIGQRIRVGVPDAPGEPWTTVIGVVADTRLRSLRNTSSSIFLPWRQAAGWQGIFALRTTRNTKELGELLQTSARAVDPTIVLGELQTMNAVLSEPLATPRFTALLIATFGLIALGLASVGLYGVMSANVREQTREIGIRSALGATPARVFLTIVRHGLTMATAGAVVGVVIAVATTHTLRSVLYNVSPTDPISLALSATVLLFVAAIATCFPARRALRVNVVSALRNE